MYNVVATVKRRTVLEGEALSFQGLCRALSLVDEYSVVVPVFIAIHSTKGSCRNVIRYLPVSDLGFGAAWRTAALIDINDNVDDDVDDIDEDDDTDDQQKNCDLGLFSGR